MLINMYRVLPWTRNYFKCFSWSKPVPSTTLSGCFYYHCLTGKETKAQTETVQLAHGHSQEVPGLGFKQVKSCFKDTCFTLHTTASLAFQLEQLPGGLNVILAWHAVGAKCKIPPFATSSVNSVAHMVLNNIFLSKFSLINITSNSQKR